MRKLIRKNSTLFCIGVAFAEYLFLSSGAQNVNELFRRKRKKTMSFSLDVYSEKFLRCEERLRRAADDGCYVPAAGGFYVPANGGFYVPAYGSSLTCQPMVLRAVARCAQARIKGHCEGEPKVLQTVGFYSIKRYIGEVINIHTHSCTYTRGSLRWRCHKK